MKETQRWGPNIGSTRFEKVEWSTTQYHQKEHSPFIPLLLKRNYRLRRKKKDKDQRVKLKASPISSDWKQVEGKKKSGYRRVYDLTSLRGKRSQRKDHAPTEGGVQDRPCQLRIGLGIWVACEHPPVRLRVRGGTIKKKKEGSTKFRYPELATKFRRKLGNRSVDGIEQGERGT